MPAWRDRFAADVSAAAGKLVGAIVAAGTREIDAALARAKVDAAAQLLAAIDPPPDDEPPPAPKPRARRAPKSSKPRTVARHPSTVRPAPSKPKIDARSLVEETSPAPHDGSAASTGPETSDSMPPPLLEPTVSPESKLLHPHELEVLRDAQRECNAMPRVRRRRRGVDGEMRSRTIAQRKLTAASLREYASELGPEDFSRVDDRPRTRGECVGGERPCPFVGCSMNLYLDISGADGIKLNFPLRAPEDMPPDQSCALDIADAGGETLEVIGERMNLTRERVRQVELKALFQVRAAIEALGIDASDVAVDRPQSALAALVEQHDFKTAELRRHREKQRDLARETKEAA